MCAVHLLGPRTVTLRYNVLGRHGQWEGTTDGGGLWEEGNQRYVVGEDKRESEENGGEE